MKGDGAISSGSSWKAASCNNGEYGTPINFVGIVSE